MCGGFVQKVQFHNQITSHGSEVYTSAVAVRYRLEVVVGGRLYGGRGGRNAPCLSRPS